jgi:hypothetical protein
MPSGLRPVLLPAEDGLEGLWRTFSQRRSSVLALEQPPLSKGASFRPWTPLCRTTVMLGRGGGAYSSVSGGLRLAT